MRLQFLPLVILTLALAGCSAASENDPLEDEIAETKDGISTLPSFASMWQAYPKGEAEDVKRMIGGNVDADWIENTCTIRISRSFNESGAPIPKDRSGLLTVRGGDGRNYALRVAEFRKYMLATYGVPTIRTKGRTINEDGILVDADPKPFAGKKGIVMFDVGIWSDATGHFDLWNGYMAGHDEYFADARAVWFWELK